MTKAAQQQRIRIFSTEDLDEHNKHNDCWVSYKGNVYDVTGFLDDHPGGDDLIMRFAGKDVTEIMADSSEHSHSDSAYEMLHEFKIGRIGVEADIVKEDWEPTDDFHPEETDQSKDFEKCQFLDLRRPLLRQMWESNFSKRFYLQQVHQPRHTAKSARLFGPAYLEVFTVTSWYVVPIVWLPIALFLFTRSALQFTRPVASLGLPSELVTNPLAAPAVLPAILLRYLTPIPGLIASIPSASWLKTIACFFVGNFIWTILEYGMHRFLFHIDEWLPDRPIFLTLHFLLHGIHHYLPMDRLRLVMPPLLFTLLQYPFTRLAYKLFPVSMANGIISGSFTFYVAYDVMHYALHHTKLPQYLREQKKYHLAHHYKNFELGFGVSSKFWDVIFNTTFDRTKVE